MTGDDLSGGIDDFRCAFVQGDARRIPLKDECVQMVVTSPPYYGLRQYGVDGQIGLEETPEAYISELVQVFREIRRVLKKDGVVFLNLGDSYASAGGDLSKPRIINTGNARANASMKPHQRIPPLGFKPKDLMMIPHRVAIALQEDGWWVRADIVWHKKNAMPSSVKDRPSLAHEYIFLLAKSARYYYDADAIREPLVRLWDKSNGGSWSHPVSNDKHGVTGYAHSGAYPMPNPLGRNKRSVWTVSTKPFAGAHFATFPPDLIEPCVLAGSRTHDIVLDPFSGAGTTGIVCAKHVRRFVGIELNKDYIRLAQDRLAVGVQSAMF